MTNVSTPAAASPGFRPGAAVRLAILGAAFFAEKIFLNGFVDFDRAQSAHGLGAMLRAVQHWGFRFLVALAAALVLFAYVRGRQNMQAVSDRIRAAPMRVGWLLAHLLLVALLAPLSFLLYRYTATDLSFAGILAVSAVIGVAAVLTALLALAPLRLWMDGARALGAIWGYASIAALLGTSLMQLAQSLWAPTAALTFNLVGRLLVPIMPRLSSDPVALVLSTDRFAVQIADECSGLEGVGLMLAFSCAWLIYFRREYIFPRALLLIPAGIATIFCLNVLRIAALILIGNGGFPEVAVYGFHSQAGWIAFIAVACGLVILSRRSNWLNPTSALSGVPSTTHNPTAAYLVPLLAILAAGTLSRAISSDFEFLYSLRLIGGVLALVRYRRELAALDWRWTWRGPALGVLVFLIWMLAAHVLLRPSPMPGKLASMSPMLRGLWVAGRIAGSVLVVPIAEELAYRGYLMRRFISAEFEAVPFSAVHWPALAATAIVFGLAHGTLWLPGIIAGLGYGLIVIRRGRIGEAFTAHATTNALIAGSVLAAGQWQLW